MYTQLESIPGISSTGQLTDHLKEVPAPSDQLIKFIRALKPTTWKGLTTWSGFRRNQIDYLLFLEEVWLGQVDENLVGRFDLSFRRLAPIIPNNSMLLKKYPRAPKEVVGRIDPDLPFNLVAARLLLLPNSVEPLSLDFNTGQQYETPKKRPWIASFTFHQAQERASITATKNLSLELEVDRHALLLDQIKRSLPLDPNGKAAEWVTMNGW